MVALRPTPSLCRELPEGEVALVGYCKGSADAIQACTWTPGSVQATGGTVGGGASGSKKGRDAAQKEQRFVILF
jgi:hypothetical protein